ncbi:MAG: UDP-N-acetylglucosamine 2-epimerase (non-hydrolyzing) [Actinobacteria bacterium]|nr:MAG: UDP-N-acetylglucosamine 2-epimerase (non-hydrolyzing) [Actinomycetota bacterium]
MKIASIVGNRPQFIKSAPTSIALREHGLDEVVIHTGQHYDHELSQVFFEELGLPEPRYRLDLRTADPQVMQPPIEACLREERPDWVLVYGDTNSTLAGALAATALDLPLAHVEAGLRSGDLSMPEERNRIETDKLAAVLLCPDERSRETLAAEGVSGHAEVVGDVMADACFRLTPIALQRAQTLDALGLKPDRYLLLTLHREANTRQPRLGRIVEGVNRLEEPVLFPVHPRTRAALDLEGLELGTRVLTLPPVGYLELTALAAQARVILTDSGGLQKEAYWHGVPCVTLRPSTEWVDTVETGANTLVDDDPERLAEAVATARMPGERPQLYGDGHAAEKIAQTLVRLRRA